MKSTEREASEPVGQFPASRIAEVLGRDSREVRRSLKPVRADGTAIVDGNATRLYLFSSLPAKIQSELNKAAEQRGFDCPERMLAKDSNRWAPPISITEIHPSEIDLATRRASALGFWAQEMSEGRLSLADIRIGAARDHRAAVGFEVADSTLENLMRRAITRDSGRREFDRWELYLPQLPKRKVASSTDDNESFVQFDAYVSTVNPSHASVDDRNWAWTGMCEDLQAILESGGEFRAARRRLISFVWVRAPWLSRSKQSMAKCFDEKWRRFCAGELHIKDQRPKRSGNFVELPLSDEDEKALTAAALGGGLSAAWRGHHTSARLSKAAVQHYAAGGLSKSYVPRRVREKLGPKIRMLDDIHHGPRQAKIKGAYITRDWNKVLPGDWYQGDDCTMPAYYWEQGPDGVPRAIRGQCLAMIDCRTLRILAFALHSENHYNARVIRGLVVRTHDTYGLPREGFYFERGIWKSARLVTGGAGSADEITTEETEAGLRDHGIRFMHARLPRGKVVERVLGMVQSRLEHEPGYCGRNEQVEKFESLQRNLLLARSGKIQFSSFLLHRDDWVSRLADIFDEHNNEHQEGRMLAGLSPRECWEQRFDQAQPLVRLDQNMSYLLANHRRPLRVTKNGIRIQVGKDRFWFRNEATGFLVGRTVQVYFNPEDLSSVWMQHPDAEDHTIVVPQAQMVPAMSASREELATAQKSCADHNRAAVTIYREIKSYFPDEGKSYFRPNLVDRDFLEHSEDLERRQEEVRKESKSKAQEKRKVAEVRRNMGDIRNSRAVSDSRRLAAWKLLNSSESKGGPNINDR